MIPDSFPRLVMLTTTNPVRRTSFPATRIRIHNLDMTPAFSLSMHRTTSVARGKWSVGKHSMPDERHVNMEIIPVPDLSYASCLSSVSWRKVHSSDLSSHFLPLVADMAALLTRFATAFLLAAAIVDSKPVVKRQGGCASPVQRRSW